MAKIIIKLNNEVIDHVDLKQGDMKIGRKPGCEIMIDSLAISGEHANIFTVGDDSFIQDMGSTNGTFVNNKQITKHHLKSGDAVVIGKHTLIYITETAHARQPDDFAKTVIISPASRESIAPKTAPTSAPSSITVETPKKVTPPPAPLARHGAIFLLSGVNSGKRIELTKKITNLGRAGKRAGTITLAGDGYLLTPGEDEIPKLNGKPIPKEGMKLKNGDMIDVGGTRLQFYLK
jgi:predicted component of type VI protein secretion system